MVTFPMITITLLLLIGLRRIESFSYKSQYSGERC